MSTPALSRKRPAPGSVPVSQQQQQMQPLPEYGSASPPLSNEQFLRWGQNPSMNGTPSYAEASTNYPPSAYSANQPNPATSNQLTRRSANQLVNGPRPYNDSGGTWEDQQAPTTDQTDGTWNEKEEDLEQRAMMAKKDALAKRKQIPPFVQKLASFLESSKNTDLIRWSDDGNSFIVLDEDEFAKTLIPELFKHNNYASFVRQLNMYGFHKKVGLSDNSMRASERKNKSPSEYSNPYFKRCRPELLWLIQKPKSGPAQGSKASAKTGSRVKVEADGHEEDFNDDFDGDYANVDHDDSRGSGQRPRLLIRGSEPLPPDQLANVHRELQAIRRQQHVISSEINKLRREHEQLYSQAANFQNMHDRHENSITAILTFLATVYNRSLEGHNTQNMANMFAGVIPHDQSQANVVDVGDVSYADLNPDGTTVQRPFKKQPLLLKAPPAEGLDAQARMSAVSPSTAGNLLDRSQTRQHLASAQQQLQGSNTDQIRNIEEVTEPATPQYMAACRAIPSQIPQRDIMSVIQNTNARNNVPGVSAASDFPAALTSLENAGGNSPLTPSQRADMLRLIANGTNAQNENNNALISPNPPQLPDMSQMHQTRASIDNLARMQAEQDKSVQSLTNLLQPLSPTGSIPGLTDNTDIGSLPPALDLDQIFNSGDYFSDPLLNNEYSLGGGGGGGGHGDQNHGTHEFNFDDFGGAEATHDNFKVEFSEIPTGEKNDHEGGRIIETVNSSEATSPANTIDDNGLLPTSGGGGGYHGDDYGERSPMKRRRKNR